jgi:hypothetical protein
MVLNLWKRDPAEKQNVNQFIKLLINDVDQRLDSSIRQ